MLRSANYESFRMGVKDRRMQGYPVVCLYATVALFGLLVVAALRTSSTSPQMAQMSRQDLMATLRSVPATVRFSPGFASTMKGCDRSSLHTTTTRQRLVPRSTDTSQISKREQLKQIKRQDGFNRMGFKETRPTAEKEMLDEFQSDVIKDMRDNLYTMEKGDITFRLAKDFGFCWGVERAVQMAIEAKLHYGDKTIHITNEIIHNPGVNDKMAEMGVKFVPVENGVKKFDQVEKDDVVILPAFGATLEEMKLLTDRGVQIVDTTCPWVSKVWNSVDAHTKGGMTSIIHGTWSHEETIATASFAELADVSGETRFHFPPLMFSLAGEDIHEEEGEDDHDHDSIL